MVLAKPYTGSLGNPGNCVNQPAECGLRRGRAALSGPRKAPRMGGAFSHSGRSFVGNSVFPQPLQTWEARDFHRAAKLQAGPGKGTTSSRAV